jgi:ethanolamine utilization protein EutA
VTHEGQGHDHDHGHGHDHDHDLSDDEQRLMALAILEQETLELLTVGIDIGSSTSHLLFARIMFQRQGRRLSDRFVVVDRTVVWRSPILLTPFLPDGMIDASRLSDFVHDCYRQAGLTRADVDTGAVILTGEAVKRKNAQMIDELFASESGKFVCATAGHRLESILAAHGSGATALAQARNACALHIDIGGGTTKFALIDKGEIADVSAIAVGGRLVAQDATGAWTRVDDSARLVAAELGLGTSPEALADEHARAQIAARLASLVVTEITGGPPGSLGRALRLTEPLRRSGEPEYVTFSGGVAEYLSGRDVQDYGDIARMLATEVAGQLAARAAVPVVAAEQLIRATVIGASQFTAQVSGKTTHLSAREVLPVANIPVVRLRHPVPEAIDPDAIARELVEGARLRDVDMSRQVALYFSWSGHASYQRLAAMARAILAATGPAAADDGLLVLVVDADIAQSLGAILKEETGLRRDLIALDGIELRELDFIDIGEYLNPPGVVPVVIKSLLFAGPEHSALAPGGCLLVSKTLGREPAAHVADIQAQFPRGVPLTDPGLVFLPGLACRKDADRATSRHHRNSVVIGHYHVARRDQLAGAHNRDVDVTEYLLDRPRGRHAPGPDGKPQQGELLNVATARVDHQAPDPACAQRGGEQLAEVAVVAPRRRGHHEDVAVGALLNGNVDHPIVAGWDAHGDRGSRDPGTRVDRGDPGREQSCPSLRLVRRRHPELGESIGYRLLAPGGVGDDLCHGSLPRQQRDVDDAFFCFAADGPDRTVDFGQSERVGGQQFQREAPRCQLPDRQLTGLVAMPPRAPDGDGLLGELLDREIGESRYLTLDHDRARPPFECVDAEQDGRRAGAGGAVKDRVHPGAAGDRPDPRERIFLADIDDMVGTERPGQIQAGLVPGGAGHDDERRACLLARDDLRQPLLAGPLDQHGGLITDAGVEQRPLDPVRERGGDAGQLVGDGVRKLVQHGVPRQEHVPGEAAPQAVRVVRGRVPVAARIRIGPPVRVLAVPVLAQAAPLTRHAGDVVLDEDPVAFCHTLALSELASGAGDHPHVLVAHDDRCVERGARVHLHVGPADPGHVHPEQRAVLGHVGHRELAELGAARARPYGGENLLSHGCHSFRSAPVATQPAGRRVLGRQFS